MPQISKSFEFYNIWITKNCHTTQVGITMPQMVHGRKPDPILSIFSNKVPIAGYYRLGSKTHAVSYVIEGSFRGTLNIQVSNSPNPNDTDWIDLTSTQQYYTGLEATGGAGISGGFSGAVSRPIHTDLFEFTGNFAWARVSLNISQGTLQCVNINF